MVSFPKISPNLLLGVGGVIAAVFLVNELRKAGGDLQTAIAGIKLPSIGDISFPEFPTLDTSGFDSFLTSITDIFKQQPDTLSQLAGQTIVSPDGTTVTIPADTTVDPETGIVTSETPPTMILSDAEREAALIAQAEQRAKTEAENILAEIPQEEDISGAEFTTAINEAEFRRRQEEAALLQPTVEPTVEPIVESLLPTEQVFLGEGPSFIGGTIFENPIDTLTEVLQAFPELTASQASDFLAEFSGILPSELAFIDPDIKNIVAGIDGEQIQVETVTPSTLETEEQKAACISCSNFGLNCDICGVGGA